MLGYVYYDELRSSTQKLVIKVLHHADVSKTFKKCMTPYPVLCLYKCMTPTLSFVVLIWGGYAYSPQH